MATEVTTATEGWRVVIERGEQTRSWVSIKSRGLGTGVQSPLPEQPPRMLFLPAAHASACDMVSPGRFIRDSVPRVALGAGPVATLCRACPQIPDPGEKQVHSINHAVCTVV